MLEKLGLGTVQFGQNYGISNTHGRVPPDEVAAILKRASAAGIRVLDTAANYGDAEAVLGRQDTQAFRVVTKTIGLSNGLDAVLAGVRRSVAVLKRVDLLLVHAAADLAGTEGAQFWDALQGLKKEGVVGGVGISAYVAENPAALAARFRPDAMQVPFSLLDQRLLRDGSLARLQGQGVEVHARSLFLQGLLLMENPPSHLAAIAPHLKRLRADLKNADTTPLAAALGFVLSQPEIAVGLVGVTSTAELEDIIRAANQDLPDMDFASFALDDAPENVRLLNPSLW